MNDRQYFAVYALDRPGVLAQREQLRPAHRVRLRQHDHPVTVHVGGPLLDSDGGMVGTLLVIEAADRIDVDAYLREDPYILAGIFASIEIKPFAWGLGVPEQANG